MVGTPLSRYFMKSMTSFLLLIGIVALLVALTACDNFCVCHEYDNADCKAKLNVRVDWQKCGIQDVSGMSVIAYDYFGISSFRTATNLIDRCEMQLIDGSYDIVVFNQTEDEHAYLKFKHLNDMNRAEVCGVDMETPSWLDPMAECIDEPDALAVGRLSNAVVTDEMVTESKGKNCKCTDCDCVTIHDPKTFDLGTVKMQPFTWTLNVKINIRGINSLKSARASINGLAGGLALASGRAIDKTATQLIRDWSLTHTTENCGYIQSKMTCFGLPEDHLGATSFDGSNILYLELLLIDGETVIKALRQVGYLISVDESNRKLTLEITLEDALPDVKPGTGTGGGFNASVDDWEDTDTIDIVL